MPVLVLFRLAGEGREPVPGIPGVAVDATFVELIKIKIHQLDVTFLRHVRQHSRLFVKGTIELDEVTPKSIQDQADFAIEKISVELDRRLENLGSLMHEKFVRTQTFPLIEVE